MSLNRGGWLCNLHSLNSAAVRESLKITVMCTVYQCWQDNLVGPCTTGTVSSSRKAFLRLCFGNGRPSQAACYKPVSSQHSGLNLNVTFSGNLPGHLPGTVPSLSATSPIFTPRSNFSLREVLLVHPGLLDVPSVSSWARVLTNLVLHSPAATRTPRNASSRNHASCKTASEFKSEPGSWSPLWTYHLIPLSLTLGSQFANGALSAWKWCVSRLRWEPQSLCSTPVTSSRSLPLRVPSLLPQAPRPQPKPIDVAGGASLTNPPPLRWRPANAEGGQVMNLVSSQRPGRLPGLH